MTTTALAKLKIEHLRGSTVPFDLSFEKGKKLTVIYGENGAGKTTICDALEFLAKGRIGSLEGRGLGSSTGRYWPSLGKSPSDVAVTLESVGSTCTGKVQRGNATVTPDEQRPSVEVLRRNQILRLLEAAPGVGSRRESRAPTRLFGQKRKPAVTNRILSRRGPRCVGCGPRSSD
jgi:hypothetical protein